MASEVTDQVTLRDDFYRDSFGKVLVLMISIAAAFVFLVVISIYFYMQKPKPTTFAVSNGFRIQAEVPLDQPYLSTPDVLQWVNDVFAKLFIYDFIHYDEQLNALMPYFTSDGWKVFLNQLNNYASKDTVENNKLFVTSVPAGAPVIFRQGLMNGRYAWQVNVPVNLNGTNTGNNLPKLLKFQVVVVRVPTANNLSGLSIDNMIVLENQGNGS